MKSAPEENEMKRLDILWFVLLILPMKSIAVPIETSSLNIEVPVSASSYMMASFIPIPAKSSLLKVGDQLGTLEISTSMFTPIKKIIIKQGNNAGLRTYRLIKQASPTSTLIVKIGDTPTIQRTLTGIVTESSVPSVSSLILPLRVAQAINAPAGIYKGNFTISIYGE